MIESKTESTTTFFVRDEKEAKRICGSIARMVRDFWQNVDKVVDFRANVIFTFVFQNFLTKINIFYI